MCCLAVQIVLPDENSCTLVWEWTFDLPWSIGKMSCFKMGLSRHTSYTDSMLI